MRLDGAIEPAETKTPARRNVEPSPALSIIGKAPEILKGRVIGCLVSEGSERTMIDALRQAIKKEGAKIKIVAPRVGGVNTSDGEMLEADLQLAGAPSVVFDAVAVIVSQAGCDELTREAAALDFVSNAFNHLKVIAYVPAAEPLLRRAGITVELTDSGVVALGNAGAVTSFIAAAKKMRIWDREPKVRNIP